MAVTNIGIGRRCRIGACACRALGASAPGLKTSPGIETQSCPPKDDSSDGEGRSAVDRGFAMAGSGGTRARERRSTGRSGLDSRRQRSFCSISRLA
jgi:hypothetical protein